MNRAQSITVLKVGIVALGAVWRMAMIPSAVEVLFGVTPYLALVSAWEFLKRPWVIGAVAAIVGCSDVSACLAARRAMATSSMGGVALIMQLLFALCVVGIAVVLTFFFRPDDDSRSKPFIFSLSATDNRAQSTEP
jgi:hypothetical protein